MQITAGTFKGHKLIAPPKEITRPTLSKVRMAIFNSLASEINFSQKSFYDMFSGSGIMGLEAISRGFGQVCACEINRKVAAIIKENYSKLKISPQILIGDALKIKPKTERGFDVIYIDPPYFSGVYENALENVKDLLSDDGIIIIEHPDIQIDFSDFEVIKKKNYGGKNVTFLKKQSFEAD